jgi:hypothetical protein
LRTTSDHQHSSYRVLFLKKGEREREKKRNGVDIQQEIEKHGVDIQQG